jgi:hypothetical protein
LLTTGRATKPGGCIEHIEVNIQFTSDDGTVGPGNLINECSQLFIEVGETMGRTFKIPRISKRLIEEAGFVDRVEKKIKLPSIPWMFDKKGKELGNWSMLYLTEGLCRLATGPWLLISLLCGKVIVRLVVACF